MTAALEHLTPLFMAAMGSGVLVAWMNRIKVKAEAKSIATDSTIKIFNASQDLIDRLQQEVEVQKEAIATLVAEVRLLKDGELDLRREVTILKTENTDLQKENEYLRSKIDHNMS